MRCGYLAGTLVAILACSASPADDARSGGAGAAGATTGACSQPPVPASEVASRDECRGAGCGGADCPSCDAITVELSQTLPREGLTATIATSNDDVFVGCDGPTASLSCEPRNFALVERLVVALSCDDSLEEATSFRVEVSQQGVPIGVGDFAHPSYSCVAHTVDDWCWEADPVVLVVSP